VAVGTAAVLAVAAFMLDALGPVVDARWMSEVSPFYWYLGKEPLIDGFDTTGLAKLAVVPIVALTAAFAAFPRRDLRV
jgi:ABC-2 type transport system permease protein